MKATISKILEITENSVDAWKYLQYFRSQSREQFALIYPDPESILESWDSLFHDLRILYQLDLFPLVVLDSGLPGYVKRFLHAGFKDWDESYFPISILRKPSFLKQRVLDTIFNRRKIPILLYTNSSALSKRNFISELLEIFHFNKLVFLKNTPGIRSVSGERISLVNLSQDYENIQNDPEFDLEDKNLLKDIHYILERNTNRRLTVSITSASLLLRELFTVKGSGTLVKRGTKIFYSETLKHIDLPKVQNLVESSFRKKCSGAFLESLHQGGWEIIYESEYKACALFFRTKYGIFLSKFAVDEIARGEGIGREIWDRMKLQYSFVFWRSKRENPIANWYMKEADGMIKSGAWIYFWIGEYRLDQNFIEIVRYMQSLPEDWENSQESINI